MPYNPTTWSDRQVQNPMQFTITGTVSNGGTVTLTPSEGNIIQPGTPITSANLNNIEQGISNAQSSIDTHNADYVKHPGYATATGTANTYAVTLNPVPTAYVDGMGIVVKINIASTGASTLNVNGLGAKTIKDSLGNDITSGGLKANTPYTLRYEATSGNFIVQGKGGGGNATASQLISGATATVDSGQITGTMPNKVGSGTILTPSTADQAFPQGYYGGVVGDGKVIGDANLIAANILSGKSIFGVVGNLLPIAFTAGTTQITNLQNVDTSNSTSGMVKIKEAKFQFPVNVPQSGTFRISFDLESQVGTMTAYAQIYKNGVPYGTLRSNNATSWVTYTEDLVFNNNDLIQLYAKTSNASYPAYTQNLTISINNLLPTFVVNIY